MLRIGYLSTLYHTAHILRARRWVEEELGRPCRWLLFGTGPEMIEAFGKGELDLGYIGLPPAIIGISRGLPLVCVGGGHVEGTVLVAPPPFEGTGEPGCLPGVLGQLAGHRLGIPAAGSIHDVISRHLLREHHVRDVEIVNYAWADLIPYDMKRGRLDGAVGTPPLAVLCERECKTSILAPPAALWPFNPSYGIVACGEAREASGLLQGFLSLHERACNLIREDPRAAARATTAALPGIDEPFVQRVYAVSHRYCASLPDAYVASTERFLDVLQDLGYLKRPVDRGAIFELRHIREIHPEPHHYRSP